MSRRCESQQRRALLPASKLLQEKTIAIENDADDDVEIFRRSTKTIIKVTA